VGPGIGSRTGRICTSDGCICLGIWGALGSRSPSSDRGVGPPEESCRCNRDGGEVCCLGGSILLGFTCELWGVPVNARRSPSRGGIGGGGCLDTGGTEERC
jgi:hypothetical protein